MEPLLPEDIKLLIQNSPYFVSKCLISLYNKQTTDEKLREDTHIYNNVGFNGVDAPILTSFAKQCIEWTETPPEERKFKYPLSFKQHQLAQKKLQKYAKQLSMIISRED